jgi:hypothetical protein
MKDYPHTNCVLNVQSKIINEVIMNDNESLEAKDDIVICEICGNNSFRVYISIIIDDARLYCNKCGHQVY